MADKKISALTEKETVVSADTITILDSEASNENKKVTLSNLKSYTDQDLSLLALKSNVLALDNTTEFTPDGNYEPATKKYVDDNAGGMANPMTTAGDVVYGGVDGDPTRLAIGTSGYYMTSDGAKPVYIFPKILWNDSDSGHAPSASGTEAMGIGRTACSGYRALGISAYGGITVESENVIGLGTGRIYTGCNNSIFISNGAGNSMIRYGADQILIGRDAIAMAAGAVGTGAGVTITRYADYGAVYGFAGSVDKKHGIGLGYYPKAETTGEITWGNNQDTNHCNLKSGIFRLSGATTDDTETELFQMGLSNERLNMPTTNCGISIKGRIDAADLTNGKYATFEVEALIARVSGTVSAVGTPTVTAIFSNFSTDPTITVSADDTNKAIKFTATGFESMNIKYSGNLFHNAILDR
jgi:hypothetical protein